MRSRTGRGPSRSTSSRAAAGSSTKPQPRRLGRPAAWAARAPSGRRRRAPPHRPSRPPSPDRPGPCRARPARASSRAGSGRAPRPRARRPPCPSAPRRPRAGSGERRSARSPPASRPAPRCRASAAPRPPRRAPARPVPPSRSARSRRRPRVRAIFASSVPAIRYAGFISATRPSLGTGRDARLGYWRIEDGALRGLAGLLVAERARTLRCATIRPVGRRNRRRLGRSASIATLAVALRCTEQRPGACPCIGVGVGHGRRRRDPRQDVQLRSRPCR